MACTASIPQGGISLQLPGNSGADEIRYREEVTHPALPFPKVAKGTLRVRSDGKLIRHQLTPEVEIVEIGEDVLQIRKGEGAEPNMLPIPESMKNLLGFLRHSVSRDNRRVALGEGLGRTTDPAGWRMAFGTYEDETSIWLLGCGTQMVGFLIRTGEGVERRTMFDTATDTSG